MGYSRAYLRFRGAENVPSFKEYFEAKAKSLLRKEHGNRNLDDESRSKGYSLDVIVQYAPYQTVSHDKDAPKRNKWQSSLENDEEFQAFREGLLREDGEGKDDEFNQKVQEIKSNQEIVEGKPKETALMKYVTQLHKKKAQEKVKSKREGQKQSNRQSKNETESQTKKVETKMNVVPKVSKKQQSEKSLSGMTKNKNQDGKKSGAKGKQSNATGPEKLQSKKKDKQKNQRDLQKRQDSTGSSLISVEGKSIVKGMPKNASASSARGSKSPSKPPISILQKPKETHLVSTSTESNKNNVQDGSKEVKFKILTRKEKDANVDRSKLPQIPPGLPKASEKSTTTEAIKGNAHPRKDKSSTDNEGKNAKEGEASNQAKGRQKRRGPRRQKKTDGNGSHTNMKSKQIV